MNCPHCHKPLDGGYALRRALDQAGLTASERNFVNVLFGKHPSPVTAERLFVAIWGIHNEPPSPRDGLNAHVTRARRKLEKHGWTISSVRFYGYRLQEMGVAT